MSLLSFPTVLYAQFDELGFEYYHHLLAYSVGGLTRKVDCIVVTSSSHPDVLEGDILVSINGIPLINNILLSNTTQLSYAQQTMTDQSHGSRQLVLLRSGKGNGYDPSYNMTIFRSITLPFASQKPITYLLHNLIL